MGLVIVLVLVASALLGVPRAAVGLVVTGDVRGQYSNASAYVRTLASFGCDAGASLDVACGGVEPSGVRANASLWVCSRDGYESMQAISTISSLCGFSGKGCEIKALPIVGQTHMFVQITVRDRYYVMYTIVWCENNTATSTSSSVSSSSVSSSEAETYRSDFSMTFNYTFLNLPPWPQLSLENQPLPILSAINCVSAWIASALVFGHAFLVQMCRWRHNHAPPIVRSCILVFLGCLICSTTLETSYWNTFSSSGVPIPALILCKSAFEVIPLVGYVTLLLYLVGLASPGRKKSESTQFLFGLSLLLGTCFIFFSFYQVNYYRWCALTHILILTILGIHLLASLRATPQSSLIVWHDVDPHIVKLCSRIGLVYSSVCIVVNILPMVMPWYLSWAKFYPLCLLGALVVSHFVLARPPSCKR
ncbi:hypothetical protein Pelo_134 [Pelomyxa schiedti]|nr:hypothetical protein Pelo_134 [Pelomyxa schiedti]